MVRYKTEPGEKEQKILAEISLNTPNNLKRRKVTSAVSAVLCVIYAAFAVWMFVRGVVGNGFLLLGFAVLFLLIALFSKKFQLFIVLRLMKKRNKALVYVPKNLFHVPIFFQSPQKSIFKTLYLQVLPEIAVSAVVWIGMKRALTSRKDSLAFLDE